jgi:signal transduction histidine kinase
MLAASGPDAGHDRGELIGFSTAASECLTVEDDGIGPGQPPLHDDIGFGLIGLRERLALLDGSLEFAAREQGGSRLSAKLPAVLSE